MKKSTSPSPHPLTPMPSKNRPLWKNRWLKLSYGALTGTAIVLILGILILSTSQNI